MRLSAGLRPDPLGILCALTSLSRNGEPTSKRREVRGGSGGELLIRGGAKIRRGRERGLLIRGQKGEKGRAMGWKGRGREFPAKSRRVE